ncbi:MAG: glycine--tRNA ligase subunit beta [Gammaproteobacteria bacterium]|nr:glycine--tRNA ligase subunit beta [Gammaproteobacteria bacterium]
MTQTDFLFELGCEELPAAQLKPLSDHLQEQVKKALDAAQLKYTKLTCFYTPRRLALLIDDLALETEAKIIERRGPSKSQGLDATGAPTKALEGFLKSCNATRTDLIEVPTDKGPWLAVKLNQPALLAKSLLPEILAQAVKSMPMKKSMRWGSHDFAFLRPVSWIVALLGTEIVPLKLFGLEAGRHTFGHRFHHPESISLNKADEYVKALHKAHVMIDQNERRHSILTQTESLMPKGLEAQCGSLDEVVNLVEWPVALLCQFKPEFLEVPDRALIATMEANQRVFPVRNQAGALQPYFVTIANIESQQPQEVIAGNEKVVGARLSDARFFYQEDLKIPLENHLEALKKITFQQGLGSLFDKTQRLMSLVDIPRAAELCKTDLVTQMVQEFPELQGYMGYQYALLQGEKAEISEAIEDHYQPKGKSGALPRNPIGIQLALMDKLDTLVGLFAMGKEPTSSGDPYALRRQALGVIAILVESECAIDLKDELQRVYHLYQAQNPQLSDPEGVLQKLTRFFEERMEVWYRDEKNFPASAVKAILKAHHQAGLNPFAIFERIQALTRLLETQEGQDLKELAKRIANILDPSVQNVLDTSLFQEEEAQLYSLLAHAKTESWLTFPDISQRYVQFLKFKPALSAFFEAVMVNDPDPQLRQNRQSLLKELHQLFAGLADFSIL